MFLEHRSWIGRSWSMWGHLGTDLVNTLFQLASPIHLLKNWKNSNQCKLQAVDVFSPSSSAVLSAALVMISGHGRAGRRAGKTTRQYKDWVREEQCELLVASLGFVWHKMLIDKPFFSMRTKGLKVFSFFRTMGLTRFTSSRWWSKWAELWCVLYDDTRLLGFRFSLWCSCHITSCAVSSLGLWYRLQNKSWFTSMWRHASADAFVVRLEVHLSCQRVFLWFLCGAGVLWSVSGLCYV